MDSANMVANVANCGRFVWCQNDPFCLNTGHCPKTREIGQKGRLDNCETVTEPLTSRGRFLRYVPWPQMANLAKLFRRAFLAEIYGVEDRRPGPTPQVGCPNLAKDRVNTMSTSPKSHPAGLQLALYRGPLHPEFSRWQPEDPAPQRIRSRSLAVPRRPHRSLRIRSKLCHEVLSERLTPFRCVG